jgi:hypothetical protein
MSHASSHARHEQARKRHRKEAEAHAREAAKRPKDTFPIWILVVGIGALLLLVVTASIVR